jgi:hypothetical protein
VYASQKYEPPEGYKTESHVSGYENKFYFGTKEYMDEFALKLKEAGIPFVRYKSGAIGYKSIDKEKVNSIGDALNEKHFHSE